MLALSDVSEHVMLGLPSGWGWGRVHGSCAVLGGAILGYATGTL